MNAALSEHIARLRRALEASDDLSIGYIAPPAEHVTFPSEIPASYQEFLRVANGAVCGVVTLFESEELMGQQAIVKTLPAGRARWFCFGSIDERPLLLDVNANTVYLVDEDEAIDLDESLGELHYFLSTCVFGEDYAEFVLGALDDGWLALLHEHPFVLGI